MRDQGHAVILFSWSPEARMGTRLSWEGPLPSGGAAQGYGTPHSGRASMKAAHGSPTGQHPGDSVSQAPDSQREAQDQGPSSRLPTWEATWGNSKSCLAWSTRCHSSRPRGVSRTKLGSQEDNQSRVASGLWEYIGDHHLGTQGISDTPNSSPSLCESPLCDL